MRAKSANNVHQGAGETLADLMRRLLKRSRSERKLVLHKLLVNLLGNPPREELEIFDSEGMIFAYLLPPAERLRLRMLEEPEFFAELDCRSRSSEPSVSLKDVVKKLHARSK